MNLRRSLSTPIPAIFDAAESLIEAVECHLAGDRDGASVWLKKANDQTVWAYTDQAWGKGATARYAFAKVANAPPYLPLAERPRPRMPDANTRGAAIGRDGHHCRFCGIPVVDPRLRKLFVQAYPEAVSWGPTNATQHAAFQCMWLQYDHILPNSRGGDSSLNNIVITCAPCNFGRMEATLAEARLLNPLDYPTPVLWKHHAQWDGLSRFQRVT